VADARAADAAPSFPDGGEVSCVLRPEQIEGPYFVDEQLNRSDIRSDPTDGTVKAGTLMRLGIRVGQAQGAMCLPLAGAVVDLWQCDAVGIYSDALDINGAFNTQGKKFLRGLQMTDAGGSCEFVTIFPGWYPGRTVHLHLKIRARNPANNRMTTFTTQLYFTDAITDEIHAMAPYAARGRRTTPNARDGSFADMGSRLIVELARQGQGYAGVFPIGIRLA
jgi:protocatechuate 3,4-dioxygenase beta subunit